MQKLLAYMRNVLARYSTGQKAAILFIVLMLAGGIYLLYGYATRPQYRVLFSGLEDKDAAQVTAALEEMKVDYKVEGASVLVPAAQVEKLRMQLAAKNLPAGGKVGFEIFDKSSFGASEFNQRVNYQRALEGELARTISSLEQVQSADVHIAMPEQSLFSSQEETVTASVLLALKGGVSLDRSQVQGIRNLVACAVEGLKPENVTVVDGSGRPLLAGDDGSLLAADRLHVVRTYEAYMEASLQQVLEQVIGSGKGLVKVHLDLDLSSRTTQTERYVAPQEGGLPSSAESSEEIYNNATGETAGAPGTGSNIPDYTSITTGGGGAAYTKRESNVTYDNNRTVIEEVSPPGEITGISISVLLDQSVDSSNIYALRDALAAAAGLKEERGDTISVQQVPFEAAPKESEKTGIVTGDGIMKLAKTAGLALAAVAAVFLLMRKLKKIRKRLEDMPELAQADLHALEEATEGARALMERPSKSPIMGSLELLAAQRPDEMARLLKAMMHERG